MAFPAFSNRLPAVKPLPMFRMVIVDPPTFSAVSNTVLANSIAASNVSKIVEEVPERLV